MDKYTCEKCKHQFEANNKWSHFMKCPECGHCAYTGKSLTVKMDGDSGNSHQGYH